MFLPSLENLAYPPDDGDHPEGGHCAGLGGNDAAEDRVNIVSQYLTTVDLLVNHALASGNGWELTRPILFAVHQLCEDALAVALSRVHAKAKNESRHGLPEKVRTAAANGAYDHASVEERDWCVEFIETIDPFTLDGFPGRFAQSFKGGAPLDELWCCINPAAIRDAAVVFTMITVPELEVGPGPVSELDEVLGSSDGGVDARH